MKRQRKWRHALGRWLLAAGLAGQGGCMTFLNPAAPPTQLALEQCHSLPKCCRNHVYMVLVNGLDPLHCGNLPGVRDYLQGLGFRTYYGEVYHGDWLKRELRKVHQEDPQARFVLVGYSAGGNVVHGLAQDTQADGIFIDTVVYLDAPWVYNSLPKRPANVGRVVSIYTSSSLLGGHALEGADNYQLTNTKHLAAPTHELTLELLAGVLAEVAVTVPVVETAAPVLPGSEEPTPRPRKVQPAEKPDEWDFLKPASRLHMPPSPGHTKR